MSDAMISILEDILEEIRGLRSDFMEFTGYNVHNMKNTVEDLRGETGYDLGDLHERLIDVSNAIGSLEAVVDLK